MLDRSIPVSPLVQPRRAASEEDDDCTQQRADGRDQDRPSCSTVMSVGVGAVVIDIGSDNAEQDKVDDHDDHGGEEGHQRDNGRQERTDDSSAGGKKEGNKIQAAGDRVEDHDAGQNLGGGAGVVGELGLLNARHYVGGAVADVGLRAASIADIVQAVAKCAKRD